MSVRVRFAPSPTGHLHVGNVRTALYNWLFSRQQGGSFILRIEDTDLARSERHYEQGLLEDLSWLGLDWQEGPDRTGPCGPYRQSDRLDIHRMEANKLLEAGSAYYCFCSPEELESVREEQLTAGQQPRYSGKCRSLAPEDARKRKESGEPATLRLRIRPGRVGFDDLVFGPIEVDCSVIGDFVLARSDGTPQYNFAVVVDDIQMRISHVIRGEGHISNTHRQLLVYEALGSAPPTFAHLSTILGSDGTKLSKRHGSTSIDQFRSQGYLPEALANYLALLGWAPSGNGKEILTREQLISEFDLTRVNKSPAVFDLDKLNWMNRSHLKVAPAGRLAALATPFLRERGWLGPEISPELHQWLENVLEAVVGYLDKMADVGQAVALIFDFNPARDLADPEVQRVIRSPKAVQVIRHFYQLIETEQALTLESYKRAIQMVKDATGLKGRDLFHPIRVALTARSAGPELDKLVPIFERGASLNLATRVLTVRERVSRVLEKLP